jgi:rhomboid family GlyGly-CTERM serine protease
MESQILRHGSKDWDRRTETSESYRWQHIPFVTAALALLAVAASLFGEWSQLLTYDRVQIAAGELWRFVTGHLVHWNGDHLLWDVVVLGVLGALVEQRDRRALTATLLLSAVAISAAVWMCDPLTVQYRGLSGVDSALFGFVAPLLFVESRRNRQTAVSWLVAALATGFVAKVGWEIVTGQTLFVDSAAAGFVPLPLVHAVGAIVGFGVWLAVGRAGSPFVNTALSASGKE